MAKLKIDWEKVKQAREAARQVVEDVHVYTQQFTTTTIERSICRLFGIDGVDAMGVPLPNVVVEHLTSRQMLGLGVTYWLGQAALSLGKEPRRSLNWLPRESWISPKPILLIFLRSSCGQRSTLKKLFRIFTTIASSGKKDCLSMAITPDH